MASNYQNFFEKDYQELVKKYDIQSEEYKQLKYEYQLLQLKYKTKERQLNTKISHIENSVKEKYTKIIDEKDKEIVRLKALLNYDGTTAGISTSQTSINKKKIIPNTRIKSDKNKDSQLGHKKHKLEKFVSDEINDNVEYTLDKCPCCNGNLEKIGEVCKDELSYRFVTIKRRNHLNVYIVIKKFIKVFQIV